MEPLGQMLFSVPEGDGQRTPNHYCTGPGCLICITRGRTLTTSTLQKYSPARQHSPDSDDESANPRFSGVHELSISDIVRVMSMLNSEPEPPHECRVIPCDVCGRKWC